MERRPAGLRLCVCMRLPATQLTLSLLPSLPPSLLPLPLLSEDNVSVARPEAVGLGKALADEMAQVARRFEGKGEVGREEGEGGREGQPTCFIQPYPFLTSFPPSLPPSLPP